MRRLRRIAQRVQRRNLMVHVCSLATQLQQQVTGHHPAILHQHIQHQRQCLQIVRRAQQLSLMAHVCRGLATAQHLAMVHHPAILRRRLAIAHLAILQLQQRL